MDMKQMTNKTTTGSNVLTQKAKYIFMVAAFLIFTSVCFAQDGSDPGGGGTGNPDDTNTPFDGGVCLLVAAGIGYGVKKAYDAKRKEAAESVEEEATI
jgi:hypothetical protein